MKPLSGFIGLVSWECPCFKISSNDLFTYTLCTASTSVKKPVNSLMEFKALMIVLYSRLLLLSFRHQIPVSLSSPLVILVFTVIYSCVITFSSHPTNQYHFPALNPRHIKHHLFSYLPLQVSLEKFDLFI